MDCPHSDLSGLETQSSDITGSHKTAQHPPLCRSLWLYFFALAQGLDDWPYKDCSRSDNSSRCPLDYSTKSWLKFASYASKSISIVTMMDADALQEPSTAKIVQSCRIVSISALQKAPSDVGEA